MLNAALEQWEMTVASSALGDQEALVAIAIASAEATEVLDSGHHLQSAHLLFYNKNLFSLDVHKMAEDRIPKLKSSILCIC